MSTGNLNLDLLVKLLRLTTSGHDGEALSAMRKANAQLDRLDLDWEQLLKGKVTMVADPFMGRNEHAHVSTKAPPNDRPRPQPTPPPQAQPQAYTPPPRPQGVKPKPQWTSTPDINTSSPANSPAPESRRMNLFAGKCTTCLRNVPAGKGYLAGKNSAGQFQVVCGRDFGHNAKYAKRDQRPAATPDDLADLI